MKNNILNRYLLMAAAVILGGSLLGGFSVSAQASTPSLVLNGRGTATFTSSPAGISCQIAPNLATGINSATGTCAIPSGATTLTLTASSMPAGTLIDWGVKGCASTATTCSQTISNKNWYIQVDPSPWTGWWKFDDVSGLVADDSSGSGNNGTLVNMTNSNWVTAGVIGGALQFNGGQYVSLGNVLPSKVTNFSISCWVNTSSSSVQEIVSSTSSQNQGGMVLEMADGNVYFGNSINYTSTSIQNGWHNIVGTMAKNGTSYVATLYVDANPSTPATINFTPSALAELQGPWAIGAGIDGSMSYKGLIDDVRIYNQALNINEVMDLYEAFQPSYTIAVNQTANGTITCTINGATCPSSVPAGSMATFTAAPNSNYVFNSWSGITCSTNPCTVPIYVNTTVSATFALPTTVPVTVKVNGAGGTVNPAGPTVNVPYGLTQIFTITYGAGYTPVLTDTSNGTTVTEPLTTVSSIVSTYTLKNVTVPHTIAVSFAMAPTITTNLPATVSVAAGSKLTLSVTGTGGTSAAPLTFQWWHNGNQVTTGMVTASNGLTSTYTVASASSADGGSYQVVVSNSVGNVSSAVCAVTLAATPTITTNLPATLLVGTGSKLTLSVVATGSAPLSYKWYKGTTVLEATTSTYTVASASSTDAGSYSVVVSNSVGSVTSATCVVTLAAAPTITTNLPATVSVAAGSKLILSVTGTGGTSTAPLTFQWWHKGNLVTTGMVTSLNGLTSTYTVTSASSADGGSYQVVVSNSVGSVNSAICVVTVTLAGAPTITTNLPATLSVAAGSKLTLSVTGTGGTSAAPLTFQWWHNGNQVTTGMVTASNGLTSTYTVASASSTDGGSYQVVVSNSVGSVNSAICAVTVTSS